MPSGSQCVLRRGPITSPYERTTRHPQKHKTPANMPVKDVSQHSLALSSSQKLVLKHFFDQSQAASPPLHAVTALF